MEDRLHRKKIVLKRRVEASSLPTLSRKAAIEWATLFNSPELLADAELANDSFVALGIVSFEVVE